MKERLTSDKSMFSAKPQKQPKSIQIREAEGGFIVTNYDNMMGPPQDKIYASLEGLHECLDEKFGKGKKKDKEESKEY